MIGILLLVHFSLIKIMIPVKIVADGIYLFVHLLQSKSFDLNRKLFYSFTFQRLGFIPVVSLIVFSVTAFNEKKL